MRVWAETLPQPPADFDAIRRIIQKAGIKAQFDFEKREGYHGGVDNTAETVGGLKFLCGAETKYVQRAHEGDLLRPIEIYKERPIFYSLGDFALQLYNVEFAPEEMYAQYGLDGRATVHELLKLSPRILLSDS